MMSYQMYQLKLMSAQLRKDTAQLFRLIKSARIFINFSWHDDSNFTFKKMVRK